jgi:hypothetical protein
MFRRTIATLLFFTGTFAACAQHAGDVWVARDSLGQLKVAPSGFQPNQSYASLGPANGPIFFGWADNDPGFDRLVAPDPNSDTWSLESGVQVWLEVVAVEPAFQLIDAGWNYLDTPGEDTLLGNANLHVHNTLLIDSTHPQYNPNQCVWDATFFLRDEGSTSYADSLPFTFHFTNVPWGPGQTPPSLPTGDFDGSATVDAEDYPACEICLAGPDVRPAPDDPAITTCEVDCANAFDFDVDLDVDLSDLAAFQAAFGT